MKKIFTKLLFIFSTSLSAMVIASHEQAIDKIVAIINDEVVTQTELKQASHMFKMQMAQTGSSTQNMDKFALDQLVNKKLQLQAAKQAGINATDNDVDKAIESVAKQNNLTANDLYERITQEGLSKENYRAEIRDQLIIRKVQQQEFGARMIVSPQEIANYMKSSLSKKEGPKQYRILDVLIPISDDANEDQITQANQTAQQVAISMRQGKNIRELVSQYKVEPQDFGLLGLGEIPSAFADIVATMKVKEISHPIQTGNGFHIIQLTEIKREVTTQNASQDEVREILLQRKFEEAMQTWLSKLKSQAYIVLNG